jgi:hypothetical protein
MMVLGDKRHTPYYVHAEAHENIEAPEDSAFEDAEVWALSHESAAILFAMEARRAGSDALHQTIAVRLTTRNAPPSFIYDVWTQDNGKWRADFLRRTKGLFE